MIENGPLMTEKVDIKSWCNDKSNSAGVRSSYAVDVVGGCGQSRFEWEDIGNKSTAMARQKVFKIASLNTCFATIIRSSIYDFPTVSDVFNCHGDDHHHFLVWMVSSVVGNIAEKRLCNRVVFWVDLTKFSHEIQNFFVAFLRWFFWNFTQLIKRFILIYYTVIFTSCW